MPELPARAAVVEATAKAPGRATVTVRPAPVEAARRDKVAAAQRAGATDATKLDAILANTEAILSELRRR